MVTLCIGFLLLSKLFPIIMSIVVGLVQIVFSIVDRSVKYGVSGVIVTIMAIANIPIYIIAWKIEQQL